MGDRRTDLDPCPRCQDPDCRADLWAGVVASGSWRGRAMSAEDAERTASGLRLSCDVRAARLTTEQVSADRAARAPTGPDTAWHLLRGPEDWSAYVALVGAANPAPHPDSYPLIAAVPLTHARGYGHAVLADMADACLVAAPTEEEEAEIERCAAMTDAESTAVLLEAGMTDDEIAALGRRSQALVRLSCDLVAARSAAAAQRRRVLEACDRAQELVGGGFLGEEVGAAVASVRRALDGADE